MSVWVVDGELSAKDLRKNPTRGNGVWGTRRKYLRGLPGELV